MQDDDLFLLHFLGFFGLWSASKCLRKWNEQPIKWEENPREKLEAVGEGEDCFWQLQAEL